MSLESRAHFLALYHEQFIGRISIMLESGMEAGQLRRVDSQLATWTLLGMMYPYFQTSSVSGLQPAPDQIEELVAIYFDGIGVRY